MFVSKVTSFGTCIGGIATIYSFSKSVKAKDSVCHDCESLGKRLPKARELPLYDKKDDFTVEYDKQSELPLINKISGIRLQLSGIVSYLSVFKKEAVHIYETGVAHSQSTYDYITNEENQIPRILTITSAGLVGILIARKGGYFKKVCYGSISSGLTFSAFYPSTAKEYFSSGFEHTKYYASNILEQYGGYDTKKISDEANAKAEYIKSTLKLEGLTNKLKEWFEQNKETASKSLNTVIGNNLKKKEEPSKTSD